VFISNYLQESMLEGSILQKLTVAHQRDQAVGRSQNFGVYYKNTLVALCHALEDYILTCSSSPLVIAAFQRGKWYLQEAERYGDLAAKSRQIVIMAAPETGFAEHPTSQRSNVELVELNSTDPVAQEWHLMILSPTYTAMVLCQELPAADYGPAGPPTEDRERKFYGFWTFEAGLVQETVDLAIAHIGQYNPELQQRLKAHVQAIAEESRTAVPGELDRVVSKVVEYLQMSQQDLNRLNPDSYASLDKNLVSNELQAFLRMAQLVDLADAENPTAAAEVAALAEMMGQLLDLPARQVQRLRLASFLHRIGPLPEAQRIIEAGLKPDRTSAQSEDEASRYPMCPLVPGAQVLRMMPRLKKIAQIINHQTEWWNGSGQPAGLVGDKIPLESRILGLVADFQQRVAQLQATSAQNLDTMEQQDNLAAALGACQAQQGRWDPELVDTLALLVSGLQQGMSLPMKPPKLTASMWLLDVQVKDDLIKPSYVREEVYGY
jgi:DICT domain-containing protein